MRYKVGLLILMTFLTATGKDAAGAQQVSTLEDQWTDLTDFWRATMEESGVVGSSLMILYDGVVQEAAYYGFADRASQRPVDEQTIYHWASITKTLTGIAVMQLRDRGLLELDDPVVDYIPELSAVHNPFGDMQDITIRQLMSHTSGFRMATWPWGGNEDWHPHEPTKWEQLVAMFPYTKIHFTPGSKYSYSNPGVIFLGRIVELLTGDDYEVYMGKNVLGPLGMEHSYFDHTPYHLLPYRSNNYYITDGSRTANGLDFDTGITVSNGGLNAPLSDMARYLAFLTGAVDADSPAGGILKRSSLEEMWELQRAIEDEGGSGIGLSFFIREEAGERVVGHTGSQKGFRSFFYFNPATGAAAVAVFNTTVFETAEDGSLSMKDAGFSEMRSRILQKIFPLLSTGR